MLSKMFNIVSRVHNLNKFVDGQVTGFAVSQTLKNTYSRATVYRALKKAEKLKLIRNVTDNQYQNWVTTEHGEGLLDEYRQLPF